MGIFEKMKVRVTGDFPLFRATVRIMTKSLLDQRGDGKFLHFIERHFITLFQRIEGQATRLHGNCGDSHLPDLITHDPKDCFSVPSNSTYIIAILTVVPTL